MNYFDAIVLRFKHIYSFKINEIIILFSLHADKILEDVYFAYLELHVIKFILCYFGKHNSARFILFKACFTFGIKLKHYMMLTSDTLLQLFL